MYFSLKVRKTKSDNVRNIKALCANDVNKDPDVMTSNKVNSFKGLGLGRVLGSTQNLVLGPQVLSSPIHRQYFVFWVARSSLKLKNCPLSQKIGRKLTKIGSPAARKRQPNPTSVSKFVELSVVFNSTLNVTLNSTINDTEFLKKMFYRFKRNLKRK